MAAYVLDTVTRLGRQCTCTLPCLVAVIAVLGNVDLLTGQMMNKATPYCLLSQDHIITSEAKLNKLFSCSIIIGSLQLEGFMLETKTSPSAVDYLPNLLEITGYLEISDVTFAPTSVRGIPFRKLKTILGGDRIVTNSTRFNAVYIKGTNIAGYFIDRIAPSSAISVGGPILIIDNAILADYPNPTDRCTPSGADSVFLQPRRKCGNPNCTKSRVFSAKKGNFSFLGDFGYVDECPPLYVPLSEDQKLLLPKNAMGRCLYNCAEIGIDWKRHLAIPCEKECKGGVVNTAENACAFVNCTSISGNLEIAMDKLIADEELRRVTCVAVTAKNSFDAFMTSVFGSVTKICGHLSIAFTPCLTNLNFFTKLQQIGGLNESALEKNGTSLMMSSNFLLADISRLKDVEIAGNTIIVAGNAKLCPEHIETVFNDSRFIVKTASNNGYSAFCKKCLNLLVSANSDDSVITVKVQRQANCTAKGNGHVGYHLRWAELTRGTACPRQGEKLDTFDIVSDGTVRSDICTDSFTRWTAVTRFDYGERQTDYEFRLSHYGGEDVISQLQPCKVYVLRATLLTLDVVTESGQQSDAVCVNTSDWLVDGLRQPTDVQVNFIAHANNATVTWKIPNAKCGDAKVDEYEVAWQPLPLSITNIPNFIRNFKGQINETCLCSSAMFSSWLEPYFKSDCFPNITATINTTNWSISDLTTRTTRTSVLIDNLLPGNSHLIKVRSRNKSLNLTSDWAYPPACALWMPSMFNEMKTTTVKLEWKNGTTEYQVPMSPLFYEIKVKYHCTVEDGCGMFAPSCDKSTNPDIAQCNNCSSENKVVLQKQCQNPNSMCHLGNFTDVHRQCGCCGCNFTVTAIYFLRADHPVFFDSVQREVLESTSEDPSSSENLPPKIYPPICVTIVILGILFYAHVQRKKKRSLKKQLEKALSMGNYEEYEPDDWELPDNSITLLQELGEGAFGLVYKGMYSDEKTDSAVVVAVKTLKMKTLSSSVSIRERNEFLTEASVMKKFSSPYIVQLLGIVSLSDTPKVVMEFMALGDLKTFLRDCRGSCNSNSAESTQFALDVTQGPVRFSRIVSNPNDQSNSEHFENPSLDQFMQFAGDLARGIHHLFEMRFVHRDLSARNCMLTEDLRLKVGDFGLTRDIYQSEYYRKRGRGCLPLRWMAPESLRDGLYTTASDIWSYGIVLWEMATLAALPYQGLSNEQVMQNILNGQVMEVPETTHPFPQVLKDLMLECWSFQASKRPSIDKILLCFVIPVSSDV